MIVLTGPPAFLGDAGGPRRSERTGRVSGSVGKDGSGSVAAGSGVALIVPGADGPARPVELSVAGCLALSRAALQPDAERWLAAAADPAVAAWMVAEPAADKARLAARLRSSLVAGAGPLAPEAAILVDAAQAAAERHAFAERFDAAVAEARFEALRELAYGAGHEINNPLANIAARAQALLLDEKDQERRRRLSTIVDQAFRARDMIGGLMVFARPPKPQRTVVAIDAIVRAVVESAQPAASARGARLEYSPPPTPVDVLADAAQVAEAVRAIVVNGCEAVDDGGRVTIEARGRAAADGGGAEIIVSDDGKGMDAETLRRAFDPFFSGREAGRGIGLGLPKARRLIEANAGDIGVESRPGHGTRVTVRLADPAAETAR